jgi:hypothetical protein
MILFEQPMHLSNDSPYIMFIPNEDRSPLIYWGMIPRSLLSQSRGFSLALASFFLGWFNTDVRSSTPMELAMQQRAGLETVHCWSRVLSAIEFLGATISLQK